MIKKQQHKIPQRYVHGGLMVELLRAMTTRPLSTMGWSPNQATNRAGQVLYLSMGRLFTISILVGQPIRLALHE